MLRGTLALTAGLTLLAISVDGKVVPAAASSVAKANVPGLDPSLFSKLASGVVMIRGFSCSGTAKIEGSGFLVGSSVVMTARHVVDPAGQQRKDACRVRVRLDGRWVAVGRIGWWSATTDPTGRSTDLATIKLLKPAAATDFVFGARNLSPPLETNLAMIGFPLGNEISLTQGLLLTRVRRNHVPLLVIRLLGAEGSSGSPVIDDSGHLVGVLQLGLGGRDVLGQRTAGVVAGIDLASWWGTGRRLEQRLCEVYPNGGIPGCATTPPPTTAPGTTTVINTTLPPGRTDAATALTLAEQVLENDATWGTSNIVCGTGTKSNYNTAAVPNGSAETYNCNWVRENNSSGPSAATDTVTIVSAANGQYQFTLVSGTYEPAGSPGICQVTQISNGYSTSCHPTSS